MTQAADARAAALGGQSIPLDYKATDKVRTIDFLGYEYTRTPSDISGALMTRADVDKLTCSTTVTTVLGIDTPTGWQPVNVGTTQRFATRAQRAALETRDGPTCIAEGCTVPTNRTIAHHLTHWNRGGRSDINNYALVCGCHHNDAHHNRLQLVIKPDGSYTLTRRRN